jgi:hypothetical protein
VKREDVRGSLSVVGCGRALHFGNGPRTTNNELLQRIDHEAAEQFGVEVGALCGHAFAVAGDGADVVDRGGHYQGGQFEPAAGAGLAGGVAASGVAFF